MGELSFRYWPVPLQFRSELKFTYWYSNNRAYDFAYQRLKALSDVTRFNDPVAVMKVATGLVNMYELFTATDIPYPITFHDSHVDVHRESKSFERKNSGVFNHRESDSFIRTNSGLFVNLGRHSFIINKNNLGVYKDEAPTDAAEKVFISKTLIGNPWNDEFVSKNIYTSLSRQDFLHRNMFLHSFDDDRMYYRPQNWQIHQDFLVSEPDNIANWYENLMAKPPLNITNYVSRYEKDSIPMNYILNWYENPIVSAPDIITNWLENITGYHQFPQTNWYENINTEIPAKKPYLINWYENIHAKLPFPQTNWYEDILGSEKIYSNNHAWYEIPLFSDKDGKYGTYGNIVSGLKNGKYGMYQDFYSGLKNGKYSFVKDILVSGLKDHKYSDADNTGTSIQKFHKYSDTDKNYIDYSKLARNSLLDYENEFVDKYNKPLSLTQPDTWINKQAKPSGIQYVYDFAFKVLKDIKIHNAPLLAFRVKYEMEIMKSGRSLFYDGKPFDNKDYAVHILKISKEMYRNDEYFFTDKDRLSMSLIETEDFLYKSPNGLFMVYTEEWLHKDSHDLKLGDIGIFLNKTGKEMMRPDTTEHVYRKYLEAELFRHHNDFIIPVSRVQHHAFTDMIDEWISRSGKVMDYIDVGDFVSPIPPNAFLNNNPQWIERLRKNIYIQHTNNWVTKSFVKTSIYDKEDVWFNKVPKDYDLFTAASAWKKYKTIRFFKWEWIIKGFPETFLSEESINKLGTGVFSDKTPQDFRYHEQEWIEKIPTIGYYDYGNVFSEKRLDTTTQDMDSVGRKTHQGKVYDLSSFTKDAPEGYYANALVMHDKVFNKNLMVEEWEYIEKTFKECHVRCECVDNWAWVFENPDPFHGDPYGIDELLLPENDIRYEDFEDLIFDKENLKPRNPVEKLSEQTWIAKLPIKHPIPQYKDVAVEYTGIKIDQYYGVRTMIMHQIYLKYYEIWQANLFEFAQMTMQQSTQKMLEYTYSWIMMYYPEDQLKEALRVLRQIRWFSEMAVMNNSRYVVSYEWDELKSELTSGECKIPNNLLGNDTMYVDKELGVIRNNAYHVGADRAYVELYLTIRKSTTIKFSLINTVGSVNIYIDDVLVDTVSVTTLNLTYPVEYTGKRKVTVRIEKTKENNLNDQFMIGNIVVPDGSYKDLSIFYDPDLKNGNQPIDEVAKKMIQWANMRSDAAVAYDSIQKNNLGVTVTMNRMLEYWELHHNNKIKGKRLCIKRV